MGIQNWSEEIILVDLPPEPDMGEELKTVTQVARDRGDCEVVIDFSKVDDFLQRCTGHQRDFYGDRA
jgi:hypothetical protein